MAIAKGARGMGAKSTGKTSSNVGIRWRDRSPKDAYPIARLN
jgi:hypothetical protein